MTTSQSGLVAEEVCVTSSAELDIILEEGETGSTVCVCVYLSGAGGVFTTAHMLVD